MSHLRCNTHERRIVILPSGGAFHRNGDGSRCADRSFRMGDQVLTAKRILDHANLRRINKDVVKTFNKNITMVADQMVESLSEFGRQARAASEALAKIRIPS